MTSAAEDLFPVGTLVWAKVQGFSAWPAKVEAEKDLPAHVLEAKPPTKAIPVFFFGSHEFGWIQSPNLQEYHAFKDTLSKKNKSKQFLKGLEEINDPSLWPEMSSFQSYQQQQPEQERKRKSSSTAGQGKRQKTERKIQIGSNPKDRLMKLRLKLQMFLQQTEEYSVQDYQKANQYLTETEKVEMDVNLFKETKIGKVIKHLSKKSISQHEISARCKALTEKWILELQDSINSMNTPTTGDEKIPKLDHDGDVDMKSPVSPKAGKVAKVDTESTLQTEKPSSSAKSETLAKPNSPAKEAVKQVSPKKEVSKPASAAQETVKPVSPVKEVSKVASPVKEKDVVKPASPLKEVTKPASPVKEVKPASPTKAAASPASPGKTLVSPASPAKEETAKIASPVKTGSPVKEARTTSPVKVSEEIAKPASPTKESLKSASPVKQATSPVKQTLPVKPASPVKEATKSDSPVKAPPSPTKQATSPVKESNLTRSPLKATSPLKETSKPVANEPELSLLASATKAKVLGV